jgi:hypothetical protein
MKSCKSVRHGSEEPSPLTAADASAADDGHLASCEAVHVAQHLRGQLQQRRPAQAASLTTLRVLSNSTCAGAGQGVMEGSSSGCGVGSGV